MKKSVFLLLGLSMVAACSDDGRPRDAIETEFSTTVVMGAFDVEVGMLMHTTVYVSIEGRAYELGAVEDAEFIGFEDLSRMELNGRRAFVAGDIVDGVFMATYAELIPAYEPSADADADDTGSSEPSITPELEERLAEQSMLNSMLFDLLHRHADLMNEDMRQRESGNQTEAMRIENERELGAMQAQIDEAQQRLRLINRELEEAGIGR